MNPGGAAFPQPRLRLQTHSIMASASKAQDYQDPRSYNKHLRPFGKRTFHKSARKAQQRQIRKDTEER
jgi:hypothetical protein